MDYIKIEDVANEVKNFLSSYFENNLVDDSILYFNVKYLNKRFGLKIKNIKYDLLEVKDYKANLPTDFYKMKKAVALLNKKAVIKESDYKQPVNITEEISHHKINHCELDVCTNECGEIVRLVQSRLDNTIFEWSEYKPLHIRTITKNVTSDYLYNKKIEDIDEIVIKDNEIITNFSSGEIYIEYYSSLEDEEGNILIPNNEILIKAYRTQMIKDVFEYLMLNSTENVVQKYQLATLEAAKAFEFAKSYLKTPELKDINKIGSYQKNKYNNIYNFRK